MVWLLVGGPRSSGQTPMYINRCANWTDSIDYFKKKKIKHMELGECDQITLYCLKFSYKKEKNLNIIFHNNDNHSKVLLNIMQNSGVQKFEEYLRTFINA